jgi:Flp pilus assembly protein TadD
LEFYSLLNQIIPNLVFIAAILGILIVILRHLPEAARHHKQELLQNIPVEQKLLQKGLPAIAISKAQGWLKIRVKKIWLFTLEAKDLKPSAITGYRIQKLFRHQKAKIQEQRTFANALPSVEQKPVESEQYYLDKIKEDPKDLHSFAALAKFYTTRENFHDATDLYQYLIKHDPINAEYHSRLAYCYYRTNQYEKASRQYEEAIALDSTQPNRYYNLGVSLDLQGKTDSAIKALEQAIALEHKNSRYYVALGNAYMKIGDKGRAKMILREARKFDPGNKEVEAKLNQISAEPESAFPREI